MSERVTRWVGVMLVGLVPFGVAWCVRDYYLGYPPTWHDVFGSGDAMLVVVTWAVGAIVDLLDSRLPPAWRHGLSTCAALLVVAGSVAYGCRTADSVTGRVQTPEQAQRMTEWSIRMLVGAALMALIATGARQQSKGEAT